MKPAPSINIWKRVVRRRRLLFLTIVLATTVAPASRLAIAMVRLHVVVVGMILVGLFGILFAWISFHFWTAATGFVMLLRRYDRFSIQAAKQLPILKPRRRTAILMPTYNEDVTRLAAGMEVIYHSLAGTGSLEAFDFYILSDSDDPDTWVVEEIAWAQLCGRLNAFGRLFYRHRRPNPKRKSGNIAEFCRRWGHRYDYMVVLDVDSIMSGGALVRLVDIMDRSPRVGILQTLPLAVNRETLLARLQQFANQLYQPMLAAGLNFLQLGDSQYWGHNAIIRIEPFMRHCGLPKLSGRPPLGGAIWSHDFVESALMRRAGWEVWLACDIVGSYEEVPPTFLDELRRDRRWCKGNLQNLRLLFTQGLFATYRALFLKGALSYGSALLWLIYLCISTTLALWHRYRVPDYFPQAHSLHPQWPMWQWQWALPLIVATLTILFLPKVLALIWIWAGQKKTALFGGPGGLTLSLLIETILSTLMAPVRMLFHAMFIVQILMGRDTAWKAGARNDREIAWPQALRIHASAVGIGIGVGLAVALINRPFFWWLSPILFSFVMSPVLCVFTSSADLGRKFRKMGLLMIPAETTPPRELVHLRTLLNPDGQYGPMTGRLESMARLPGFVRAVVDPLANDLHIALLRRKRSVTPRIAVRRQQLRQKAVELGPDSLSAVEKRQILSDPEGLLDLHHRVWELSNPEVAFSWGFGA